MRRTIWDWKDTLSNLGHRWITKPELTKRYRRRTRLSFDTLEQRQMLTASVVDNDDTGFSIVSGTWPTVTGGVNGDSRSVEAGVIAAAEWSFSGLTPGQYHVSATWPQATPASASDVLSVEAELTQGWPTDGSDSTFAVAQLGSSAVVRSVAGTRDNAETFIVSTPLTLDKIWVEYASRFNSEGFRVVLYRVDDPLDVTLTTPGTNDPDLLLDDTIAFSEIVGALPGLTSDADRKFMAIDVDDLELSPGAYALQFFSTGPGRTFKWAEQYGSDLGGDRYEFEVRQTDDRNYRFALETAPAIGRSTTAPFEIFNGATSLGTVELNQNLRPNDLADGGTNWEDLGTFIITGTTASVELSSAANAQVIADAIRIERIADLPLTVTLPAPYANESAGTITGTVTRAGSTSGNLVVTLASSDTSEATVPSTVTILSGNASANFTITLQNDSTFDGTQPADITATATSYADGEAQLLVTDEGEAKVIDNGDTGFAVTGSWTNQSSPTPAGYQTDIHIKTAGSGSATATWAFSSLAVGTYRVSATWTADTDRATNARYSILDNNTPVGFQLVDQQTAPAADVTVSGTNFEHLGTVTIVNGMLKVVLTDLADGKVVADAVRIELVGGPLPVEVFRPLTVPRYWTDETNVGFTVADVLDRMIVPAGVPSPGVAVIDSNSTHGKYQYSLDGGATWTDVGSVADNNGLLLLAAHRVRFLTTDGFLGTIDDALTLRTWDGTGSAAGSRVDTNGGGTGTPFGGDSSTVAVQITPALSAPQRANTTLLDGFWGLWGDQPTQRNVAVSADGSYAATWAGLGADGLGVYGQWFSAQGAKAGAEFHVSGLPNGGNPPHVAAAAIPDGLVVIWVELQPGWDTLLRGRLIGTDGTPLGTAFDIATADGPGSPTVSADADGNFTVVWTSYDGSSHVMARRYDANGMALDAEATIATGGYSNPAIAIRSTGESIIVWDNSTTVYAQRLDDTGSAVGSVISVDSGQHASVSVADDGTFIVAYSGNGATISARRYNASGTLLGDTLTVSAGGEAHETPSVAVDPAGNFVITWRSRAFDHVIQGVQARWYDADGVSLGVPHFVNSDHAVLGEWTNPQAAANAAGDVVIAWASHTADGRHDGIELQRFAMAQSPIATEVTPLSIKDPLDIDLADYFRDRDVPFGDELAFSIVSNSQPARISATLSGSVLTLERASGGASGLSEVTVAATDLSGRSTELVLDVTAAADTPPTVSNPLDDVSVDEDAANSTISLSGVFSDPGDTLTYSVANVSLSGATAGLPSSVLLSASIVSGSLVLDYQPNQSGTAHVTVRATDSDGMVVEDTLTVTIEPVNDAPTLLDLELTQSQARGTTLADNHGFLVSDLTIGLRDVDPISRMALATGSSLAGIALTSTDETEGTWQFTLDGGATWQNAGAVSESSALLLSADSQTRLRFRPDTSFVGTTADALTLRAWDASTGAAGTYADTSTTGGATAYSAADDTLSLAINPALGDPFAVVDYSLLGYSNSDTPLMAVAEDGTYAVAWTDGTDIFVQRFSATGQLLDESSEPSPEGYSVVDLAGAPDGSLLVLLSNGDAIKVQRYDDDAQPVGSPIAVAAEYAANPSIAVGRDGKFLVVWQDIEATPEIHAHWFSAAGVAAGTELTISTGGEAPAPAPRRSAAIDAVGNAVIVWRDNDTSGHTYILARRIEADGDPLTGVIEVSQSTVDFVYYDPSVATNAGGVFAVAWQSAAADDMSGHLEARLMEADGDPISGVLTVNAEDGAGASVAMDDSGQWAVSWAGQVSGRALGMGVRWYDELGDPVGEPMLASSQDVRYDSINGGQLLATPAGRYLAAWNVNDYIGNMFDDVIGDYAHKARWFQVTQAPQAVPGIDDMVGVDAVSEDAPPTEIDLDAAFADVDLLYRDQLTFSIEGNDNPSLVTTTLDGGTLILAYAANASGSATLTVRATDQFGYYAEDTFDVDVDPVNDAPTSRPIPGVLLTQDDYFFSLDLKDYFADLESASENLTYSVTANTNSSLVGTAISGSVLDGLALGAYGSAVLTVRATDAGNLYGETTINVGVYEPDTALTVAPSAPLMQIPYGQIEEENNGALVADLVSGTLDLATFPGAGIAIYNADPALGPLQFSLDDGQTWQNVGNVGPTQALLLAADATTRLRFLPDATGAGISGPGNTILVNAAPLLQIAVWNGATGTAGQPLNLTTSGNQSAIAAARIAIHVQQPTLASTEFVVNTTTGGEQNFPQSAMATDGRSVTAWIAEGPSGPGIYAQRFNPDGTRRGGQFFVHGDASVPWHSHVAHDVAFDSGDDFVIVSRIYGTSAAATRITRYDWDSGATVSSPIELGDLGTGHFVDADMAGDRLVVVFTKWESAGSQMTNSVIARVYSDTNTLIDEETIDTLTGSSQGLGQAAVAIAPDETFVVAWNRYTAGTDLHARRYSFNGTAISAVAADQLVQDDLTPGQSSIQLLPHAEMRADKTAVLSWYEQNGSGNNPNAIFTALVGTNGAASTPVELEDTAFFLPIYYRPTWAAVQALDDGRLFAAGTLYLGTSQYKVVGQYFAADGSAIGSQFDLATTAGRPDMHPEVAGDGSGTLFVAWEEITTGASRDLDKSAVIARTYNAKAPAYNPDSDSVGFKPHQIYTRPISVETATGNVIFRPDRGPDQWSVVGGQGSGDGIQPVYRQTGDAHPIVSVDYPLSGATLPDKLEALLTFAGEENAASVFYSLSSLTPSPQPLTAPVVRLALQADDTSALPSGHYNWQIEVIEYRGSQAGEPKRLTGTHDLVSRRDSEFGVGWWLDSLDRIIPGDDSRYNGPSGQGPIGGGRGVLLVRGDGTAGWFAESHTDGSGVTHYTRPRGSFTELTKAANGTFTLKHPGGTRDLFLADGRLDKRIDRNENVIDYSYDTGDGNSNGATDELVSIQDIYGLETLYAYSSGYLDSVTDFAGRVTDYTVTAGYVTTILEPDPDDFTGSGGSNGSLASPETTLTYYTGGQWAGDPFEGLLYTVTTPGIQTASGVTRPSTTISYSDAGRFDSAVSADDTDWELTPAQTVGLATGSTSQSPAAAVRPSDVKAAYTNELDKSWTYTFDRFGYETSETDPLQTKWQYTRNSDGQMTRQVEPAGAGGMTPLPELTTRYQYNGPNLVKVIYPQETLSTTDATGTLISESWVYDPNFAQVTRHVDMRGIRTVNDIDPHGNVTAVHQQVGLDADEYQNESTPGWITTKFGYTDPWLATQSQTDRNLPGGLVKLVTDSRGIKTRTSYFDFGDTGVAEAHHGLPKTVKSGLGTNAQDVEVETGTIGGIVINASTAHYQYDPARNVNLLIQQMGDPDPSENSPASGDDLDRYTRFQFNRLDQLVQATYASATHVTDSGGTETAQPTTSAAYDPEGFAKSATDARGQTVESRRDLMGRLRFTLLPTVSNFEGPAQASLENRYDDAGNLEKAIDGLGRETSFTYTVRNELETTTLPTIAADGKPSVTKNTFDAVGNLKRVADANGAFVDYVYGPLHRKTEERLGSTAFSKSALAGDPVWPKTTYVHYDDGQLSSTTVVDPLRGDRTTSLANDGLGRVVEVSRPLQANTKTAYDDSTGFTEVTERIAIDGSTEKTRQTNYQTDSMGRQVKVLLPTVDYLDDAGDPVTDRPAREARYNDAGEVVQAIDARGNETDVQYDALGRRTEIELPADESGHHPKTTFGHDRAGNVRRETVRVTGGTTPESRTKDTKYDGLGRVDIVTAGFNTDKAVSTKFQYDAADQQRLVTVAYATAEARTTQTDYNAQGQPAKVTLPDPITGNVGALFTQNTFDATGNVIETIDTLGRKTKTQYDPIGRVKQVTDATGVITVYGYQAAGEMIFTQQGNRITGFVNDLLGRRTSVIEPPRDPGKPVGPGNYRPTTDYGFDLVDRLTSVQDPLLNTTEYVYWDTDWLKSEKTGSLSRDLKYDVAGNVRQRTDRNGRTIAYAYDDLNQRVSEQWVGTGANSYAAAFDYNLAGEMTHADNENAGGNISAIDQFFDELGRLDLAKQTIGNLPTIDLDYVYNLIGTRKSLVAEMDDVQDFQQSYAHDKLGHLKQTQQGATAPAGAAATGAASIQAKTVTLDYYANGQLQRVKREEIGVPTAGVETGVIDDSSSFFQTTFPVSQANVGAVGGFNHNTTQAGNGSLKATWNVVGLDPHRTYDVYATWDFSSVLAEDAKYTVYGEGPSVTTVVNQQNLPNGMEVAGHHWQFIGTRAATDQGVLRVTLTDEANGPVRADAILVVERLKVDTNYEYNTTGRMNNLRHYENGAPYDPASAIRSQALFYKNGSGPLYQVNTLLNNETSPQIQTFTLDGQDQLNSQTGAANYSYSYDVGGNPHGHVDAYNQLREDASNRYLYDDEGNVTQHWAFQSTAVLSGTGHGLSTTPLSVPTEGWYRFIIEPFHVDASVSQVTLRLVFGTTEVDTRDVPLVAAQDGGSENRETYYFDFYTAATGTSVTMHVEGIPNPQEHAGLTAGKFAVGRLDRIREYTWDFHNQLAGAKVYSQYLLDNDVDVVFFNPDDNPVRTLLLTDVEYGYNALGQRISKTFADPPDPPMDPIAALPNEYFVYDTGNIALQLEKVGSSDLRVTRRFFNGPGGELFAVEQVGYPSSVKTSQEVVWALPDYQNTVRDLYWLTSSDAEHVEHREFDPYGQPFEVEESSAGRIVEAMSAGLMLDWETGLHFDGQRYVVPSSGRYISEAYGGVGVGETNLYLYAGNNPVKERSGATTSGYDEPIGPFDSYSYYLNPVNDFQQGGWEGYAWGAGKTVGWTMAVVGSIGAVAVAGPAATLAWAGSALTSEAAAATGWSGLGLYLTKNIAVAGLESSIEAGIANYTDDKEFSFAWSFARNATINVTLGLLPFAAEAKASTKAATLAARVARYSKHYAYEVGVNTLADTAWEVGANGRDIRDVFPSALAGNLAGQAFGDVLSTGLRRLAPDSIFRLCFAGGTLVERETTDAPAGARRPIEQFVNGTRAKAAHPQWAKSKVDEPNAATWRELTLQALNKADADIEIKLLRPLKWMQAVGAEPGAEIDIEIAELNLSGRAKVLAVDPCPQIESGNGAVVTGTFRHVANELVSVYVEGLDEPIQCTPRHPFYSVKRQNFVAANQLRPGESLQLSNGKLATVRAIAPLAGPIEVYNIEVQGAHVYHVSPLGILVHNASFSSKRVTTRTLDEPANEIWAAVGDQYSRARAQGRHVAAAKVTYTKNGVSATRILARWNLSGREMHSEQLLYMQIKKLQRKYSDVRVEGLLSDKISCGQNWNNCQVYVSSLMDEFGSFPVRHFRR